MVTTISGDVVEVSIQGDFDGTEDVFNVFQYSIATGYTTDEAGFADDLIELVTAVVTIIKELVGVATIFRRFRAQIITQVDAGRLIELDAPIPGVVVGASSPAGVCALLVFRIDKPRSSLRKYLGTISEEDVGTAGDFTSGALTEGAAAIAALMTNITTTLDTYKYGHYDPVAEIFHKPTGGYMNAEPAYQRRRRRGTGS